MSDSDSESLHDAIQKALIAGDFDRVRQLSTALGQAIIREGMAAPLAERKTVVQQGLSRLSEHLSLARVLRAHVASQLQHNTAVASYVQSSSRGHSWHFDA